MDIKMIEKQDIQDNRLKIIQLAYDNITFVDNNTAVCMIDEDRYRVMKFDESGANTANINCMASQFTNKQDEIVGLSYVDENGIHTILSMEWKKFMLADGILMGVSERELSLIAIWEDKEIRNQYIQIIDRQSYNIVFEGTIIEPPITALASRAVIQFIMKDTGELYGLNSRGHLLRCINMFWMAIDKDGNIINDMEDY